MVTFESSAVLLAAVKSGHLAATQKQLDVASALNIELPPEAPRSVVAAVLRTSLSGPLEIATYDATDAQDELLSELGVESDVARRSSSVASAYIEGAYVERRLREHADLKLHAGDVVRLGDQDYVISSISSNGRIYFRGGRGQACWPDQIDQVVAHHDQTSGAQEQARRSALAGAAARAGSASFSSESRDALAPFSPTVDLTTETINAFEVVIDQADDEKPIQDFVERHPEILASLLPGRPRFVLPRVRLGNDFVPDFLMADEDSRGARWMGIELETPRSAVTLKSKRDFDQHARDGLRQVREWREWLAENLHEARRPSANLGGYGLPGITGDLDCWVVVGRRVLERQSSPALRAERSKRERIEVRTYDGLLERLRNVLSEPMGPPARNPYLLHREAGFGDD